MDYLATALLALAVSLFLISKLRQGKAFDVSLSRIESNYKSRLDLEGPSLAKKGGAGRDEIDEIIKLLKSQQSPFWSFLEKIAVICGLLAFVITLLQIFKYI